MNAHDLARTATPPRFRTTPLSAESRGDDVSLTRSHIRATAEAYLTRHPQERETLAKLLAALDAADEPSSRATLPGHVACSAAVLDRDRRVLHVGHRASWMSGPDVLAMAHRIAAPQATLAIMGDGSLWTHEADWTRALRDLIQSYLGPRRQAGVLGAYSEPVRPFQEDLADSAWSETSEDRVPVTRSWTPEMVVGYLRTPSFAGAELFGERHPAFEDEDRALLGELADGGSLLREAREETGVVIDPVDVRAAVTVHHRSPGGASRTGHFFEVRQWKCEPRIAEPDVCDAMDWAPLTALPAGMVAYCRAGLDAYTAGARLALHFQLPGDTIAFDPGADRPRLVPDVTCGSVASRPDTALVEFAERAVGRIREWTDTSWAREDSRVWRVRNAQGGTWYVKVHQSLRFHKREVRGLRTWAPVLGAAAPRLLAADEALCAVIITAVPGRPLHGQVLGPEQERACFHQIGALARRIHQSFPARPAPDGSGPAVHKAERHLAAAHQQLAAGDAEFVRALVQQAERLDPMPWVETHGDFQLRNILFSGQPTGGRVGAGSLVSVIDLERSEPGPAVRDLVRLSDARRGRPDLFEAFMAGYGRPLTGAEETRLVIDSALDAVSGIAFGTAHSDPELVERGHRTLARLRAEHETPRSTEEEPGEH